MTVSKLTSKLAKTNGAPKSVDYVHTFCHFMLTFSLNGSNKSTSIFASFLFLLTYQIVANFLVQSELSLLCFVAFIGHMTAKFICGTPREDSALRRHQPFLSWWTRTLSVSKFQEQAQRESIKFKVRETCVIVLTCCLARLLHQSEPRWKARRVARDIVLLAGRRPGILWGRLLVGDLSCFRDHWLYVSDDGLNSDTPSSCVHSGRCSQIHQSHWLLRSCGTRRSLSC